MRLKHSRHRTNHLRPSVAYTQLALLALFLALFLWWIYPEKVSVVKTIPSVANNTATTSEPLFPVVEVEARSAYVYDVKEGKVLFNKNSELQLPLASLTKLMTALTASELLPEYALVRISLEDLREEGDSGLFADEEWKAKDLIDFSLIVSSNDGAQALASVAGAFVNNKASTSIEISSVPPVDVFLKEMNKTAKRIGMEETYFLNPSGLDVSPSLSGGYGSAKDMAILLDYILKHNSHLLEATTFERLEVQSKFTKHTAVNTNKVLNDIPNVIGSKTGFTDLSGGNLVVVFDAGIDHPIILTLLGSSQNGRFKDMDALVAATVTYLGLK